MNLIRHGVARSGHHGAVVLRRLEIDRVGRARDRAQPARDALFEARLVAHQHLLAAPLRKHRHFLIGIVDGDRRLEHVLERRRKPGDQRPRILENLLQHAANIVSHNLLSSPLTEPMPEPKFPNGRSVSADDAGRQDHDRRGACHDPRPVPPLPPHSDLRAARMARAAAVRVQPRRAAGRRRRVAAAAQLRRRRSDARRRLSRRTHRRARTPARSSG